ncbi:YrhK family protein [Salinisphaera sp.]|uniref:YrhK family protein n=1 Tax=Salinisphaera sp. TaxID=1914330 RepID=UPI002D7701F1|nr:YrhK family protein [Salinisphaera sp.]HET7313913.1 YrhK family protein [Salinisphaera sp.]
MPHLITHRPRVTNLRSRDERSNSHKVWETINAFSYKIGGLTFVAGSVFYFPALSEYLAYGDWLFFIGSLLYLLVTGHDLLEVFKYWRTHNTDTFADHIEFVTAVSYVLGSALFTIGSIFFLPALGTTAIGSWCFIVGSALFVIGGFVNILQVVEAPSMLYMQLFNITVAQFIVGSALFLVATIPYLWHLGDPAETQITTLAAAQFLFASVLFFTGGIAIYYRKLVRDKLEAFCHASGFGTMFIRALRSEIHDKATLGKSPDPG